MCPPPSHASAPVSLAAPTRRHAAFALLCAVRCAWNLAAQPPAPQLPPDDRTRLAEVFRLFDAVGNDVWHGWSNAPFAVLLVTDGHEFLLRHPAPSDEFTRIGHDSLLASDVHVRPRRFSPALLATFPAVGGVPTIVVGQPSATARSSTMWILTLLHEHFHQWQMSQPGYFRRVDALGLARGDETGGWMLTFGYPYESARVRERFSAFAAALRSSVRGPSRPDLNVAVLRARRALRDAAPGDDDAYLAFQMWQEGIARYTELAVARAAAADAARRGPVASSMGGESYADAATELERSLLSELSSPALDEHKRVAFYGVGAALGLHLDRTRPGWKREYPDGPLSLERFLRQPTRSRR